jgi:predicted dehydrogenase
MTAMTQSITRRHFLRQSAATISVVSIVPGHVLGLNGATPPSQKLNLAFVGAGGRAVANLAGLSGENVVALCDVDENRAVASFKKYPNAKCFTDYRKLLDQLHQQLDGVVISTPDHTHAVIAMAAMQRSKHVYCEKPLAHSIAEVRALMQAARKYKVITQLGNQGHSFDTIRNFCEWIWDGAIGKVHTVHAFCGSNYSRIERLPLLTEKHEVPASLDWEQWLGPVQFRPYNPVYLPSTWRGWTAFGGGVVGDWTCHVVDPVFWALDLGAPVAITAKVKNYDPWKHAETYPPGAVITYEFPANAKRGPVKVLWFEGEERPPRPAEFEPDDVFPKTGAVVLGDQGTIIYGSHGATGCRLIPDAKMEAYTKPPQTLWRTKAHHQDWLNAIRTGKPAGSNFDYGGPLSELAMLGIIAMRLPEARLEWDGASGKFKNNAEANALIAPPYREGWKL